MRAGLDVRMALKRYDTLRLQLIRLYQAMEQHKGLAGEMFQDLSHPHARVGTTDPSTLRVLPTIEGSRQHVRLKDRLSLVYSESPEIAKEIILDESRTKSTVEFSAWLQEVAGQKSERLNPAGSMDMRIHLQKFEEALIYFIAFRAISPSPDREVSAPVREIEISGSGMSFPTEVAHMQGEDILVVYFVPTDPFPPLQLVAEVVRPSRRHPKGGYQTPVKYVDISQEDHQRIMGYIASRHRLRNLNKAYDIGA
jgi:hypothetical protein